MNGRCLRAKSCRRYSYLNAVSQMGQAEGFPDFVSAVKRANVRKVVTFAGNYITSLYGFVTIFAGDKPPCR